MLKTTKKLLINARALPAPAIETTRVVVVGAGLVGSTAAFAIMTHGLASEIVLIDINKEKCGGEVLDLEHGLSFVEQTKIWAGDYPDCRQADIVVICAGLKQKPGQTRLELAKINVKIVSEVVKNVRRYTDQAVLLVVTNPVDVMTYAAIKTSGLPDYQVFGSGTTLDSSRFRYLLAEHFGVATESVGAFLLGEHGDSEVPVFSHTNIMGEPIKNLPEYDKKTVEEIFLKTKNAAGEIINKKGAVYYAIALAAARIIRAVLYDENHVFPVSVLAKGEYGLKNVCLSLPAVIGRTGVKKVLPIKLSDEETDQLRQSAKIISQTIEKIGF